MHTFSSAPMWMMTAALRRGDSRAGVDYPTSLSQFLDWFHSDADCERYLARLRWPDCFSCPIASRTRRGSHAAIHVCAACGKQTSLTAGTIFEGDPAAASDLVPRGVDGVDQQARCQRERTSARTRDRLPGGVASVAEAAAAMVRPAVLRTSSPATSRWMRATSAGRFPVASADTAQKGKVIVAVAVERKGLGKKSKRWKLGRTRIQVVPDVKAKTLLDFVEHTCEQGSTIYTDGLSAYKNLRSRGFDHKPDAVSQGNDPAHVVLPAVHRVASLVKRWLLGTHHGGIGAQHVEAYLDEFIFRFNRRQSNARGLLFYRLLENTVVVKKLDYDTIVWSRRGQAGKRRGPQPKPRAKRAPKGRAAADARQSQSS
jgi:transposase-like protein